MTTYVYDTHRGAGIPGLPHEVTDQQAKALGMEEILKAAIQNGSYKQKAEPKPVKPAAKVKEKDNG